MAAKPSHPLVRSYLMLKPGWSEHHKQCATSELNRWCSWLDQRGVHLVDATRDDCAEFLAERTAAVAGSTAHKSYQHLRWLYQWLVDDGEIDTRKTYGPMTGIPAPKVNDPDPQRTRYVAEADYAKILASCDKRTVGGCRDAAIMSLMYWSGLRQSEVVRCDLDRLDLEAGTIEVLGKNGKWRKIPLTMETTILLERYTRRRTHDPSPALFASLKVDEGDGRMRPNSIGQMIERRNARLNLDLSPHQFRRAMAIHSGSRGVSDNSICTIAGWADSRMLARYQRAERERLAADDFTAHDPTAQRARQQRRRGHLRSA